MAMIRPGGEALTKKAIGLANLPCGARILDIGCGEGDTVALLARQYGFEATGVDISYKLIEKGKTRHAGLDLQRMEAEFLDFESKSFDAVFMECSLSVCRLHEDAIFEAYCVLKSGGKLIISDLYRKNPDPEAVAKMLAEAREKARRPKIDNSCDENEKPSFITLDGAFVIDRLAGMAEEIGFDIEYFEDESDALAGFMAQAIMGHGSLKDYFKAVVPKGEDIAAYYACAAFCEPAGWKEKAAKNLGYFLMILRKS
jgi:SAM-dependent methyltransferase